jgi:release factor glutamine methyltransferase
LLIDKAISFAESQHITQNQQFRVLDLGTGSGCLLLACLSELKHATGVGIDINEQAIIQAQMNARLLNLEARSKFFVSNWFDGLADNSFDIVLCNPPYIPVEDEASLQDEVRLFDPKQALFSHNQGLADYEIIFASLAVYLNPNGIACVEIGYKQSEQVMALAYRFNLNVREVLPDLQGIPRCLVLCY